MRFMMLVIPKGYESAEPGTLPSVEDVEKMDKYNRELQASGRLVEMNGLHPPSTGARVVVENGKETVIDGPFPEAKEVLGGYWIVDVESREEAIDLARRVPKLHDGIIEVRQVQEFEDFPEEIQEIVADLEGPGPTTSKFLFLNLPVQDLERSKAFFTKLGFKFNPQFTDEKAACLIINETTYAMLLDDGYFESFIDKPASDAKKGSEVLVALSANSRRDVDRLCKLAFASGGRRYGEPRDHGFMYQWGWEDPDGHIWEIAYMDPSGMPG